MQTGQKVGKPGPNRPFWSGNGRGDILDRISTTVRQAGTVVVVAGGAGMGKTRLAFETTGRVEAAGIPCRVLEGTRRADLAMALDEFALESPAKVPAQSSWATGTRAQALLLVDQAEACDAQTLERLILAARQHSIAVMLAGGAELVATLVRSVSEQVCDIITLYVALEPLNAPETAEFVTHCLAAEKSPVTCGDDALRRIVAHSHGVPGAIDRMMTDALRLARLSRSARLTATVIDMIADDEYLPPSEDFAPGRFGPGSFGPGNFASGDFAPAPQVEINSSCAGMHPPFPLEPSPAPPTRTLRRQAKPVADWGASLAPPARSMQEILAELQARPSVPSTEDESDDDLEIPHLPTPLAELQQLPARRQHRLLPWAGGVVLTVVAGATSVITLQPYFHTGAPVLNLTDQRHTIVGSMVGNVITSPAAASRDPMPATATNPIVPVAMADSPPSSPPTADSEMEPPAPLVEPERMADEPAAEAPMMPAALEEAHKAPEAEPTAHQETSPIEPMPPEPAAENQQEPEPLAPSTEALSPVDPEPAPAAPPLSEPTAEAPPEPAPPEPTATVATPEPASQEPSPEPPSGRASPPEPEPVVAQPVPPPEPAVPSPAPEPVAVALPPPPQPAPAAPKPPTVAESVLLEKGDRLLALGDIASARLLYETAAAGGSARGALLAGRTLDPGYLRTLGARGVTGDPDRAAAWYERAAKLGDDSATALLEALGRR
jgi:hypothetical protein